MIKIDITGEFPPEFKKEFEIRYVKELHPLIGGGNRIEVWREVEYVKSPRGESRWPFGICKNPLRTLVYETFERK